MTRTTKPKRVADAILAADIHLRETVPECRDDDFMAAQDKKLSRIAELQVENDDCPVLVAGDIFDQWKASPWLERWAIERVHNWVGIPGQHDLPAHSLTEYNRSSLAVLEAAGSIYTCFGSGPSLERVSWESEFDVFGCAWGQEPSGIEGLDNCVALIHRMVYADKPPFPGAEKAGGTAKALLKKMKGFGLIVSGDNHQTFTHQTKQGRLLVNPGSIMRTTAAQVDHEPSVFLWWKDGNEIERVVLPYEKNIVSRKHLEIAQYKEERKRELTDRLKNGYTAGKSFRENLEAIIAANPQAEGVEKLIWKAAEA